MATIYMKIDGIDGTVSAADKTKLIELDSFSFGVGRSINSCNPGVQSNREASVPSFSEISISKNTDEASPKLFIEACIGKAKKVEIFFCNIGEKIQNFLEITLTDVIFSSYSISGGSGGGHPGESLSLNYSKIEMKYIPYDHENKPSASILAGYNLVTAQKV